MLPKFKDIKEFPLDTLWAELQEQQLVSLKQILGWNSLGLYCTCFIRLISKFGHIQANQILDTVKRVDCLRCSKSEGKEKEGNVPTGDGTLTGRRDQAKGE
jgi:hypothetical protein